MIRDYPQENVRCEWKLFKNLKNSFCGNEKDDVISYVSAIANMDGGHLVIGVHDRTLDIIGTDTYNYDRQKAVLRLTERCVNLSTEGLDVEEFITDDTNKKLWVIHIPKHRPKLPVYAHNKAWQRIEDSLVELTQERLNAILEENSPVFDWSAVIVDNATLDDLDGKALAKARDEYKAVHPRLADEVDEWDDMELLNRAGVAIKSKLTRAAILLLGKESAVHLISPAVATITWVLPDLKSSMTLSRCVWSRSECISAILYRDFLSSLARFFTLSLEDENIMTRCGGVVSNILLRTGSFCGS